MPGGGGGAGGADAGAAGPAAVAGARRAHQLALRRRAQRPQRKSIVPHEHRFSNVVSGRGRRWCS